MVSTQHIPNAEDDASLDNMWEDMEWKQSVNRDLALLQDWVKKTKSQSRGNTNRSEYCCEAQDIEMRRPSRIDTSFATAMTDGLGGLKTCMRIVRSTRLASVQCVWLSLCLMFFSYFVIFHCKRVNTSHIADFKPQKKSKMVNFAKNYEEYQMPNFSLIVSTSSRNDAGFLSDLSDMVENSEFKCHYYFALDKNNVFLAKEISITNKKRFNNVTLQIVTISPENPIPGSGPWYCAWRFKAKNFNEALFSVSRNSDDILDSSFKSIHLSFLSNETTVVSFDYSETVIEMFGNRTQIHEFFSSINEIYKPSDPDADFNVEVFLTMHPEVSYWQEYRDYTPEDAMSSLGGLLTIVSVVYFWVAYYIAVYLGRHSWEMGILPEMSFVFSNLENIALIKESLEENNLIPKSSRWFGRGINSYYGELEIAEEVSRLSIDQEGINIKSYPGGLEICKEVSKLAILQGVQRKKLRF